MRPVQTRFRFGSGPEGLNLHVSSNSPDHNARHAVRPLRTLPPLVGTRFQDLFHSPPGVLFTFPHGTRALSVIEEYLGLRVVPPDSRRITRAPRYSGYH